MSRQCSQCGTQSTPHWRTHPASGSTLCNACGLQIRRKEYSSNSITDLSDALGAMTIEPKAREVETVFSRLYILSQRKTKGLNLGQIQDCEKELLAGLYTGKIGTPIDATKLVPLLKNNVLAIFFLTTESLVALCELSDDAFIRGLDMSTGIAASLRNVIRLELKRRAE